MLLQNIAGAEPGIREVLTDLGPILESVERTVVALRTENPNARPFDINEYSSLVSSSAATASELRLLVESVQKILNGDNARLVESLAEAQVAILNRSFLLMSLLIVVFFSALLGYRYVNRRLIPT